MDGASRTLFVLLLATICGMLPSQPALSQQWADAPMPPVRYASLAADDGLTEQQAEAAAGEESEKGDLDFLDKSLSEISRTQVSASSAALSSNIETVSRTSQPLARTPAAVYVVTNDMIRRCGARNIPEVLRTVPGVNVARVNASTWAISIRGFRDRFANKLLVQIDGVPIYNPLHGGVYWDRDYVMLEDVDRIEVIRGPGGAIWGNNAVNGIINIVTKSSQDTHGMYADFGGGNEHRQFSDLRAGGAAGNLNWRVYGMNVDDDHGYVAPPNIPVDAFNLAQGGFRADWTPTCRDTITLQADMSDARVGRIGFIQPGEDWNVSRYIDARMYTRWARRLDEDTDWAMQLSYVNPYGMEGTDTRNVAMFDLDFQYHLNRGRHDVVWGFGYRNSSELFMLHRPPIIDADWRDSEQIPSYFIQDTITLVPDTFFAVVGSKFDNNSVTHFEYQPMAKAVWTPDERSSFWGAVSRTVRTPALFDRVIVVPASEDCMTYEVGMRRQPTDRLFWELTVFFNRYNNLIGETGPFIRDNAGDADTYGFEYNATYEINPRWRLTGSYSFFIECLRFEPGAQPTFPEGSTPRNQYYLQSGWDLGQNVALDVMFRYVDSLACGVPEYFVGDIRLAWRPQTNLELSVVGQNLLDGGHYEFVYTGAQPTEVEPGVYGMISWRY